MSAGSRRLRVYETPSVLRQTDRKTVWNNPGNAKAKPDSQDPHFLQDSMLFWFVFCSRSGLTLSILFLDFGMVGEQV